MDRPCSAGAWVASNTISCQSQARSDPESSYYGLTLPSVALSSVQGPLFSILDRLTILGWRWAVVQKCGVRHRSGRSAWVDNFDPDSRGRLDVIGSAAVCLCLLVLLLLLLLMLLLMLLRLRLRLRLRLANERLLDRPTRPQAQE